jgi:hypothetical protein
MRAALLHRRPDLPQDHASAEAVVSEIADAVAAEAVPLFARFGDLGTFVTAMEVHAWTGNGLDHHNHERFYLPAAFDAAEAARRTAGRDDGGGARQVAERVAAVADAAGRGQDHADAPLAEQAARRRTNLRPPGWRGGPRGTAPCRGTADSRS